MKSIYLWGAGNNLNIVKNYVKKDVVIKGIFDNNVNLQGTKIDGICVLKPEKGIVLDGETVIITVHNYLPIYDCAGAILGVEDNKIVPFWKIDFEMNCFSDFLDVEKRKLDFFDELRNVYEREIKKYQTRIRNQRYELAEDILENPPQIPIINDGLEALELIKKERKSMCRYGDGEFEIVHGRERTKLQKPNQELQRRLKEILLNNNDNILTCIARLYGSLDFFGDEMADVCREYLTPKVREENMSVIDVSKKYYDAYVSRPYIFARDKSKAGKIFDAWKNIWSSRDVVFVEGYMTRCGYKNNLFAGASSIERILCPPTDAWYYYNELYTYILNNVDKEKLILIALGPTATVLAYDLALKGYQAIDMGHLDNEYEWYVRGCEKMEKLPYKYMNNMGEIGRNAVEVTDEEYNKEIIKKIGC